MITGLTSRQKVLCDMLWACNDPAPLVALMPQEFRKEAELMMEMMLLDCLDEITTIDSDIQDYFGRFGKK